MPVTNQRDLFLMGSHYCDDMNTHLTPCILGIGVGAGHLDGVMLWSYIKVHYQNLSTYIISMVT